MSTFEVVLKTLTVEDHPNADRLDIVKVDGYNCVTQKGRFGTGDVALYVPENAVVPEKVLRVGGFWNDDKDKGLLAGSKGDRVKPVKLRGVISEGILLDVNQLLDGGVLRCSECRGSGETGYCPGPVDFDGPYPCCACHGSGRVFSVGADQDYAEALGITKYRPPIPVEMAGEVESRDFSVKYDIENFKKYPHLLREGERVYATEKIHGTCSIYRYDRAANEITVGSKGMAAKGLWLKPNMRNIYWRAEAQHRIGEALQYLATKYDADVVILFGEIYGVQNLKYGATNGDIGFRAFDLFTDYGFEQYGLFLDLMGEIGIPAVPVIYEGPFEADKIWALTEGKEQITGNEVHIREGLVVRPAANRIDSEIGDVKLKFVSDTYLGKTTGEEFD